MDEEGWWEGTLNDKTGWFPSNYVKECRPPGIRFYKINYFNNYNDFGHLF